MAQLEKEFAQTRIVKDGRVCFESTRNLVVAAFRQPSSRANDPDTHTHGVVMNMTFDENNLARSLASDIHGNQGVVEQIRRNIIYCGLIYRTQLANMLKEKGYQLEEVGDGLFEITGFSKEVLKEFSTRREEIEEYMETHGLSGAKAASMVAKITRNSKEEHDINVLRKDWANRAELLGFDAAEFVKDALKPKEPKGLLDSFKDYVYNKFYQERDLEQIKAIEAVDVAIEIISQKTSVFDARKLREFALKHTLTSPQIVSFSAIDKVINEKIQSQALYTGTDVYTKQQVLTTPWLLTLEAETLARIEVNKGTVTPITSKKEVVDFQKNYEDRAKFPLTSSQTQAMIHFLTNDDRYMAIQGYAGVGKTTMLKLTKEIAENAGFKLRGIAITSPAAKELSVKGGIKSDVFPIVHSELLRASKFELKKTIFIVDEASMLSSPQGHELIKLIEQKGARLYLVGDDAQLPSTKNGRAFGLSQEYGIKTSKMVDTIRQTNESLKNAVNHARSGEIYDALEKINEVRELSTHDKRILRMANSYIELSAHVRENTLLFAPTHANRREITQIIRKELKKEGVISESQTLLPVLRSKDIEEIQLHYAQYYAKGDVIRFNNPSSRHNIKAGEYLTVEKAHVHKNNELTLIRENGSKLNYKLNDLPRYRSTRAGFERHIEVYTQAQLELADGDKIQWTKNFKKEGISNSERATISRITAEEITVTLDNGDNKTLPMNHSVLKHVDHGYVFTNIKVQGKDKLYGVGLIESGNKPSATLRNFYVQISRAISHMKLITDDKQRLTRALEENDDTKKSAIEYVSTSTLAAHQDRFKAQSKTISIDAIIAKKAGKEEALIQKIDKAEQFRSFKEQGFQAKSAKIAYELVSNNDSYRLAKSRLGYGYQVYRKEALHLATTKLCKDLSIEEKEKLNTVRNYVRLNTATKKAWQQALKINPTPFNKDAAMSTASQRNMLAHKIATDIESYKPYLKHFSIGELNRLGLPQHLYTKESKASVLKLSKLTKQAATHEIASCVESYFSIPSRPSSMAFNIKTNSKIAHPYLIKLSKEQGSSVDLLWKEINVKAKEHTDLLFKETLPASHKKAFEMLQTFQSLRYEKARLLASNDNKLSKDELLKPEISMRLNQIATKQNEIAARVIQDINANASLAYFKIDVSKLNIGATKHQCRENVVHFLSSKSNFKERLSTAKLISDDLKAHYPFIKELNVDTKSLNKFIRYSGHQELYAQLSDAEVSDYKKVLSYKYESKKASSVWKTIYELKNSPIKPPKELYDKAFDATSKRDLAALALTDLNRFGVILEKEHVSSEKIQMHALAHKARVAEIKQLNQEQGRFLTSITEKESTMSRKGVESWYTGWSEISAKANKIQSSSPIYQAALKECPLHASTPNLKQQELVFKYELDSKVSTPIKPIKNSYQSVDITATNEMLMANPEKTYQAIFGEPKQTSSKEMRFGGGLIVSLKGGKSGMWFDFSAAQGGGPIQAIMRERGVEFKEALHIATEMAGTQKTPIYSTISPYVKPKEYSEKQELKNKIKSALSIANGTRPLLGTLGETYLKEHRKIDNPCRLNVKFWPKGARWLDINDEGKLYERVNKIPAIVIAAQNAKQEITGVQRIYLDEKSAGKNTFMGNAKLSKGHMKGSAGVIQIGIKNGEVYIAEGPETAASIAMARPKATVLTSCGIANIQNLGKLIKVFEPNRVIIAGDNDGDSKTLDTTKMAALSLKKEGIKSEIVLPKKIEGLDKTDWNDVLKTEGVKSVSNQLNFDKLNNNKEPLVSENEISKYLISEKILLKENYDLQKKHGYNIGNILENNLHIKEQIDISNKNIMDIYNKSVKDISNKNETYLNKKDIDLEL
ncbi:MAG: conjugative relaxase [Legionellales bacterium]|nr:conjugative relaxase [Legionellales bacterium]